MLPEGVYHWKATHPEWEGPVSAYAIDDGERLILIDPIAVPDDVRALFGSREVVTVLTSTWHERDAGIAWLSCVGAGAGSSRGAARPGDALRDRRLAIRDGGVSRP
jgi:hypothetical protein